jgi:hypothetical protein
MTGFTGLFSERRTRIDSTTQQINKSTSFSDRINRITADCFFNRELLLPSALGEQGSVHRSPITNYQSPITNHQLPITNYQLPITNHQSPITNHQSPITNHQSPITNHSSLYIHTRKPNRLEENLLG